MDGNHMNRQTRNELPSFMAAKFDHLLSSKRRFPERDLKPKSRYLLISTPRSGSTMIGEMLYATGNAGDPQEFLSRGYIEAWQRAHSQVGSTLNLPEYLVYLEKNHTSENGVFGMNTQFLQIQPIFKDNEKLANFIRRFDNVITLSRRDKIAQAVSWWRASYTRIWSSMDYDFMSDNDRANIKQPPYSGTGIADRLHRIIVQEELYKQLLSRFEIPHSTFVYEDVSSDYVNQSRRIVESLGIPGVAIDSIPKVQRQSTQNDPLIAAFRKELGLSHS
jgi:trehalose 2-sulfotransferase